MKYLFDTNTIIYYLQHHFPREAAMNVENLLTTSKPCLSVITEIELLCWRTATPNDLQILKNFINDTTVIELDKSIKYATVDIRKAHRIKLPDAIIAATALVYDLTLITRSVSDFNNIGGLRFINPWESVG